MAQVEEGKIAKVQDGNDLSPDEMRTDEEHDKSELEEIVQDEVTSDAGSGVDIFGFGGEDVPEVADLEHEEDNPG